METYFNADVELQCPKEAPRHKWPEVEITSVMKTFWIIDNKVMTCFNRLMQFCPRLGFFNQIIDIVLINVLGNMLAR